MSDYITSITDSEHMLFMRIEQSTFLDTQPSSVPPAHADTTWPLNLPDTEFPSLFLPSEELSSPPIASFEGTVNSPADLIQPPGFDNTIESDVTTPTVPEGTHVYRRIPGTEDKILEEWLKISEAPEADRKAFQCIWPGCTTEPFTRKCQAFRHVLKHLDIKKLYECVACPSKFATRGTATRHIQTQQASFSCSSCTKAFKREDYWRKHMRMCAKKPGVK